MFGINILFLRNGSQIHNLIPFDQILIEYSELFHLLFV